MKETVDWSFEVELQVPTEQWSFEIPADRSRQILTCTLVGSIDSQVEMSDGPRSDITTSTCSLSLSLTSHLREVCV